jgi:quercetin dioxygenase-like cupin family protein
VFEQNNGGLVMKKFAFEEIESEELGKGCKGVSIRWLITKELGAPNFAMRLFEVEPEGHTPLHTHEWEHEVFILGGEGIVVGKEGEEKIKHGDVIFMPSNEEHQFRNVGNEKLKFLCMVPNH